MLADSTEPKPLIFDTGSGAESHETTDWWAYDGTLRAPLATALRGVCSCGRHAATLHLLDWQEVAAEGPDWYDTSGPEADGVSSPPARR